MKKKRILFIILWILLVVSFGVMSFLITYKLVAGNTQNSLTDKDFNELDYVNEKLEELRNSRDYASMDKDEQMDAMLKAIRKLSKEGKINEKSLHINYENHYITYQYKCGVLGSESFDDNEYDEFVSGRSHNNYSYIEKANEYYYSGNGAKADAIILNEVHKTKNAERFLEFNRNNADSWTSLGVNTVVDPDVTVDDLAHLQGYDLVQIYAHGGAEEFLIPGTLGTGRYYIFTLLALEQKQTDELNRRYADDLKDKNLIIHNGDYCVSPLFFISHYRSGELSGSIFYIGSCMLMGKDGKESEAWTKALVDHAGVSALVGFYNSVDGDYSTVLGFHFFSDLIIGKNAKESLDDAKTEYGSTDTEFCKKFNRKDNGTTAYPVLRGDENASMNWKVRPTPTPVLTPTPIPEPTPTPVPEEITTTTESITNSKVIIEDARREEYDYYESKLVNRYPKITIKGVDTSAINKKMAKALTTKVKPLGDNMFDGKAANYEYYIGDHIVTILAYLDELSFEYRDYYVYNISIATGKEMSGSQVLKDAGLSDKKFFEIVKKRYKDFGAGVPNRPKSMVDKNVKKNLKLVSFKYVRPYYDKDGKLRFMGKVYYIAADGYGDMPFWVYDKDIPKDDA